MTTAMEDLTKRRAAFEESLKDPLNPPDPPEVEEMVEALVQAAQKEERQSIATYLSECGPEAALEWIESQLNEKEN